MANRKIADMVLNGRRLLSGEAIRRVLFNGQVIWPFTESQNPAEESKNMIFTNTEFTVE